MPADEHTSARRQRAPGSWLAALGLVLVALGPLLMFFASLVWGLEVSADLPFFTIPAVIALLAAFLVWRFGVWAKIVAIVVSLLVAGAFFWTAFGLTSPTSFFDFMPGVLVIPGALLTIVGSVAAIVARRHGSLTEAPRAGEMRGIQAVVGVVALLALVSGVLTFVSRSTVEAADAGTTVTMLDFQFGEEQYEVAGGSEVVVRNDDPFLHTFTIERLGIDETLSPGSETVVEIPDRPGTYVLFCRPHTGDTEEPAESDMAAVFEVE